MKSVLELPLEQPPARNEKKEYLGTYSSTDAKVGAKQRDLRLSFAPVRWCSKCGRNVVYQDIATMDFCEPCLWNSLSSDPDFQTAFSRGPASVHAGDATPGGAGRLSRRRKRSSLPAGSDGGAEGKTR